MSPKSRDASTSSDLLSPTEAATETTTRTTQNGPETASQVSWAPHQAPALVDPVFQGLRFLQSLSAGPLSVWESPQQQNIPSLKITRPQQLALAAFWSNFGPTLQTFITNHCQCNPSWVYRLLPLTPWTAQPWNFLLSCLEHGDLAKHWSPYHKGQLGSSECGADSLDFSDYSIWNHRIHCITLYTKTSSWFVRKYKKTT